MLWLVLYSAVASQTIQGFGNSNNTAYILPSLMVLPLFFLSSAFFPTESLTGGLALAVNLNPYTNIINILRNLIVTSPAFENEAVIPIQYTGRGEDISPELYLSAVDEGAKSIAIIMNDIGHPIPSYNHWVIWNLPVTQTIKKINMLYSYHKLENRGKRMSQKLFKWKHFESEIIILCIRWYLKYPLSYRMLVEMQERGLKLIPASYPNNGFAKKFSPIIKTDTPYLGVSKTFM